MAHAKRLALLALVAVPAAAAGSADASYHLMTVNELFPSATGSQQFVELKDPAQEPFPNVIGPYYLTAGTRRPGASGSTASATGAPACPSATPGRFRPRAGPCSGSPAAASA